MPGYVERRKIAGRKSPLFIINRYALSGNTRWLPFRRNIASRYPAVFISIGDSILSGIRMNARGPREGGSLGDRPYFNRGEKVFQVHVRSTNAREVVRLLHELRDRLPELRKRGYVGFYGFSPNAPLVEAFQKTFGHLDHSRVDVHPREAGLAQKYYGQGVEKCGFPKEYEGKEVKGLAVRIPDNL